MDMQCKWSTTEQGAYGVYYAVTKWNYYLQGAEVIVHNDHKPLARFPNGKNTNNKDKQMGIRISYLQHYFQIDIWSLNKATNCLSQLVEWPQDRPATVNMLSATNLDGSTPEVDLLSAPPQKILLHNYSQMQLHQMSLAHQALYWNHWPQIDYSHYYKCREQIHSVSASPNLYHEKASKLEADLFLHMKGLLYKHVMNSNQKFLALVIPNAWKYTVPGEAHDKLGHQGATHTYCLIKCQYYWKGMNKDIRKYIAHGTLCHGEKAKVQAYPLQMTEIPEWPFNKIAIDLVTECETSSSGNKHHTGKKQRFGHTLHKWQRYWNDLW